MLIISIVLFVISILLIIYSLYSLKHIKQKNEYVLEYNTQLDLMNKELKQTQEDLKTINLALETEKKTLDTNISVKKEQLNELQSTITSSTKAKEELSQKAFENYCKVLEKNMICIKMHSKHHILIVNWN